MKIIAINNPVEAEASFLTARQNGYIAFIYHRADPQHVLSPNKFTYVNDDEELMEKINLLRLDPSVQEEIIRW